MKEDRSLLTEGYYPVGNNVRVNRGVKETRPATLTPVFANAVAFGSILGSAIYANPSGVEVMLIATPSAVYQTRAGGYPTAITVPVTLSGNVEFSQQFDKVLLHAPSVPVTLVWDGKVDTGFVIVTKSNPANTVTSVIPTVAWSVNIGNRAIVPYSPDTLAASDILDYTTFDLTLTGPKFRTLTGSADPIVGAYPYAQSSLIVGKRNSFDLITGFFGDFSQAQVQVLSASVGVMARKSCRMVGGDLFFLHDTGVHRISQVIQDRLEAEPVPVSDPIQPLIRRINWLYADKSVAAVLSPYYFLAVPLDGSTYNNAVLVYNSATREWESYDTWASAAGFRIDNLFVADFFSSRRVYAVNHGAVAIHLLYEGRLDELSFNRSTGLHTVYEIADLFETRGYAELGSAGATTQDFKRVEIPIATWRPSITVTELTDKAGDERVLTAAAVTKDPAKYDIAFKPDYVITNANGDFDAPGRQDYALDPTQGVYPSGSIGGSNGIDGDKKQTSVLRFSTKARGRYISYRIANTQGACDMAGVLCESSGAQREIRRAA